MTVLEAAELLLAKKPSPEVRAIVEALKKARRKCADNQREEKKRRMPAKPQGKDAAVP